MINSLIDLHTMTVRDLIAALAEAEDATRRARRSRTEWRRDDPELATLVAREDVLVGELRRRTGSHHPHRV
jgi:hypothetical protein